MWSQCRQEADRMWSQLTVEKSTKRYNDPGRLIPGARFEYMGEYYVLSGQLSNGQYLVLTVIRKQTTRQKNAGS